LASDISIGEQFLWVSNQRLGNLIDFAIEVATQRASNPEFTQRLRKYRDEEYFPGCSFDLAARFPTLDERKFWAGCFHDVARRIFLRQLGNHDVSFWQASAIGDAYVVARMLTRSVQEAELGWQPATEDGADAEAYRSGGVNLRA
jgi:hypothetical protein